MTEAEVEAWAEGQAERFCAERGLPALHDSAGGESRSTEALCYKAGALAAFALCKPLVEALEHAVMFSQCMATREMASKALSSWRGKDGE